MKVAPIFRPALGVLAAALVLVGTFLAIGRSPLGAADPETSAAPQPTPTITADYNGATGANGWFKTDVTLSWDIKSHGQLDRSTATGCDDQKLTAEQPLTTYTCSVGYRSDPTKPPLVGTATIGIDKTAPTITCPSPPAFGAGGPPGTLTATVTDGATVPGSNSGPATPTASAPVDVSATSPLVVTVTGSDVAGNTGSAACAYSLVTDTTAPVVSLVSVTGPIGNDGWYIGDVTVVFSVSEPDSPNYTTSGCDPAPLTKDTDAAGITLTCTATSAGGTSAPAMVTIKRDATAPVVTCPTAPEVIQGNAVTVQATIADAASGATADTGSAVGSEYALGQHAVAIAASDLAGNTVETPCAYTVVPDPAAPVVTPIVVGPTAADPGALSQARSSAAVATWYTGDVTVRFTIDAASPLISSAGCGPVTITEDTPGVTVTCTATSSGGTTTNSVTIARDATPPTVTCQSPAPQFVNGTQGRQITPAFSDATSGVTADSTTLDADTGVVGVHTLAVSTTDQAGNVTAGQCDYQVVPDYTPPVITYSVDGPSGANGWYTGVVTVSFTVVDDDSPITLMAGCETRTIDQDTDGTSLECSASSWGGAATPAAVLIRRDTVGPTVECKPVNFVQGTPGRVMADSEDSTSGVAATAVLAQANTNTLGPREVTLSNSDQAGNTTTVQCDYDVLAAATVKTAQLTNNGQDLLPPLLIAGFLLVMGGVSIGIALTTHRRPEGGHSSTGGL